MADRPEFDPEQAFFRLDRDRKGVITASGIKAFMRHNRQDCSDDECAMFIRPFDDDRDQSLNYTEFLYCVLSSSAVYRDKVIKRLSERELKIKQTRHGPEVIVGSRPKTVHPLETLDYQLEYGIRRLVEQEIAL